MQRTRVALLRRLAPVLVTALLAPAADAAEYAVVLASGTQVAAASRPVIAMGKVSFLDEQNRPTSLPVAEVDVDATRSFAGDARPRSRVWDDKALSKLKGSRLQFYGDSPDGQQAAAVEAPAPDGASDAKDTRTGAERLRDEINGLERQIKGLPTTDRQRSMMVIRQLELQQELNRLLSPMRRG